MDIRFCDLCNESVPLSDLAEGRAIQRGDRVVCAACDAAMGGQREGAAAPGEPARAEPRAPRQRASLASKLGLAVLSFGLVGAIAAGGWWGFELHERLEVVEADTADGEDMARRLHLELERAGDERIAIDDERAEDKVRSALERQDLVERLAALERHMERIDAELASAGEREQLRFDALDGRITDLRVAPARLERIEAGLARAEEDLEVLARSMLEGLDRGTPAAGGIAVDGGAVAPATPAWQALAASLQSDDAGLRWDTVEKIGALGDATAAPLLADSLADSDLFVRMAAARVLGELGSSVAVPSLIAALEDEESSVREAAVLSLRKLTGRDFDFDPSADRSQRAGRVEAWRAWWERSGDEQ